MATTIFSMAQISIADMFCHQSFDRHVPFSVASIFNHCTMTNNQTLVMNNKGFTSFHHVFFCWPNLFILFKKFGDVFLVGKICFWSGTQSIFQHFCYIVTLVKLFTPKKWKSWGHEMMGCMLSTYMPLSCAKSRITIWIKSPISHKFQIQSHITSWFLDKTWFY